MPVMTVTEALDALLSLYAQPGTWRRDGIAWDAHGRSVAADSDGAVSWNLDGALERVIGDWEASDVDLAAHRTWYALNRVPEFWSWLRFHGDAGAVKMPAEIYAEVEGGTDELADWMSDDATKSALLLGEASDPAKVQHVLSRYGEMLSEADLITIGQAPFLIAAAFGAADRRVVTAEVSKPTRVGGK